MGCDTHLASGEIFLQKMFWEGGVQRRFLGTLGKNFFRGIILQGGLPMVHVGMPCSSACLCV